MDEVKTIQHLIENESADIIKSAIDGALYDAFANSLGPDEWEDREEYFWTQLKELSK